MRNYEMVLQALKSGEVKTMDTLKSELPGLEWWNMHKYVARAKYLAGADIELMKAGVVIKTARAKDAETLRLVNADKFKNWSPETKTGGPLFRKSNPKVKGLKVKAPASEKTAKAPAKAAKAPEKTAKAPVKAAKAPVKAAKAPVKAAKVKDSAPVVASSVKDVLDVPAVQEMIRAELAATAPKGPVKKAAALPRGPKPKRVSDEVTPMKDTDDLLDIPDFLRIQTDKSPKLAEE